MRVCESMFGGMFSVGVSGDGSGSKWSDKVEKREVADKKEEQLHGRRKEDLQRNEGGRWRRRRKRAGPVGKKRK